MSEAITHSLRLKEEREARAVINYESFKADAIESLSDCLLTGGDLYDLIEELSSNYWDIFYDDIPHSDINLFVTQAVAENIRSAA